MNERNNFIESLYDGEIYPREAAIPLDSRYWKLTHEISNHVDAFLETLTQQQKKMFDRILDLKADQESEEMMFNFALGFRLGGQCIYDVFCTPGGEAVR